MIVNNFVFYKKYEINNKKIKLYLKKNSKNKTKYVKYKNKMIKLIEYKKKIKKVNKKKGGSIIFNDYDEDYDIYTSIPLVSKTSRKPCYSSSSSSISLPKPFKSFSNSLNTIQAVKKYVPIQEQMQRVLTTKIPRPIKPPIVLEIRKNPNNFINSNNLKNPNNLKFGNYYYDDKGTELMYLGGKKSKITKN